MKVGDKVRYLGLDIHQRNWGTYTGDPWNLKIGKEYIVTDIEVHTQHTRVTVAGVSGCFNSVGFEVLP